MARGINKAIIVGNLGKDPESPVLGKWKPRSPISR
jgi:single-stranded DNA-binding protein